MTLFRRRFAGRGAPPGQLNPGTDQVTPRLHVLTYGAGTLDEHELVATDRLPESIPDGVVQWIDVRGHGDGTIVQRLGERYGFHPLAISDVVNVGQRPKVDEYDGTLFFVVRMVTLDENETLVWEQVSLFLKGPLVVTFQETEIDCLGPLRDRIRAGRPAIRKSGSDYLATMVADAIVDGYFPILEYHGRQLEKLEEVILQDRGQGVLGELYTTKRELAEFRRATWPLREALNQLLRDETDQLSDTARLHLRDTVDHVMQVVEVNESYRELAASLVDVHLSMIGQRTNEVMRVLTVVSAIFIPLTFVAGVYGMNFDTSSRLNLPELRWAYGYPYFWGLCLLIGAGLLVLFRRLGWLRGRVRDR